MDGTTKNSGDVDTNTKSSWRPPLNTVSSANEKMRTVQGVSIPNIQWPLSGAGNSENAEASFGDSTPPFLDSPEGIRGSDLADGPNDDWEVPEHPAPDRSPWFDEYEFDHDFASWADSSDGDNGQAEDGLCDEEQPAPEFFDSPEGTQGSNPAEVANDDREVPEDPAPKKSFVMEKIGVRWDFGSWTYADEDNEGQAKDGLEEQPAPAFTDSREGMRGSDPADGPNDDGEAPEDPALGEGSRLNKPAKDGPRHEEQPAPENLPDDLNDDERQMFADRPFHADQKPDFRFADPRSIHDQASLQYALFCTREDCRARLGMKTMRIQTTPEKCYAVQWLEIQRRFADVWSLLEDDEAPLLIQLKAWTDHFDNWKK